MRPWKLLCLAYLLADWLRVRDQHRGCPQLRVEIAASVKAPRDRPVTGVTKFFERRLEMANCAHYYAQKNLVNSLAKFVTFGTCGN